MKEFMTIKTECNKKYCSKCNRMYDDEIHNGYVKVYADLEDDMYSFNHEFFLNPDSNVANKCDFCGSDTLRISSIEMATLVDTMISLNFKILSIHDGFSFNMSGIQRAGYTDNASISFIPSEECIGDIEPILEKYSFRNGDVYYVEFNSSCPIIKLKYELSSLVGRKNIMYFSNIIIPKIISTLVSKGYPVKGGGLERDSNSSEKYKIMMVSTGDIENGYYVFANIHVTDTCISFVPGRTDEYLEWVESLPDYKEA